MPDLHALREADTEAIAVQFARHLRAGDLVLLSGELGAGKTSFARAVLRALTGDPRLEVPSPTFSLVQPYETDRGRVLHVDLYRLASAQETDELGLDDEPESIRLVEWPDRLPALAPVADWQVTLAPGAGPDAREIAIGGRDAIRDKAMDRDVAAWRRSG